MSDIVGISFGETTFSMVALDRNGNPVAIRNIEDGKPYISSAVYFEDAQSIIIGDAALDMRAVDYDRVVLFPKRELGRQNAGTYTFDEVNYLPTDIGSLIISHLRKMGLEEGYDIQDAVLAIPAWYRGRERIAAINMCKLAHLNVVGVLAEATAATLSFYGDQIDQDETVMVFDLGGGSFDLSILKVSTAKGDNQNSSIKIVTSEDDDLLGGKDWDARLFNYILEQYCEENGLLSDEVSAETRQIIWDKAVSTKKRLSVTDNVNLHICEEGICTTIVVTRKSFEEQTSDLVLQTLSSVDKVIQKASEEKIDKVLLVGGACRMPMIRTALENRFPGKVHFTDPEIAVAKGAAIYGRMLRNNSAN